MPINIQDNKLLLENIASASIDYNKEEQMIMFRFNDLKGSARRRFAKRLLEDSSIYTIRAAKEHDVLEVLEIANPILISGGYGLYKTWSHSTIYRWGEKRISRLVYYTLYRNLGQPMITYMQRVLRTPGTDAPYTFSGKRKSLSKLWNVNVRTVKK